MNREDVIRRAEVLRRQAAAARSRSRTLQAEVVKLARQVADTEEALAKSLTLLAIQLPRNGHRLRNLSKAASQFAALERQWADGQATPLAKDDGNAA